MSKMDPRENADKINGQREPRVKNHLITSGRERDIRKEQYSNHEKRNRTKIKRSKQYSRNCSTERSWERKEREQAVPTAGGSGEGRRYRDEKSQVI